MASTHPFRNSGLVSLPFCNRVEGMDQVKFHGIASLIQSLNAQHNLIKLTPLLLVSVSLLSFLFSPSSLLAFLHHFNFYFSTFPLQLFTHTIDKNCMFLVCNGLLVFVGITGSFSCGSRSDEEEPSKYMDDGSQSEFSDVEANDQMLEKEEATEKTSDEPEEQNTEAGQAIEIKYSSEQVRENIEKIILVDEEQGNESGELEIDAVDEEEEKGSEIEEFLIEEKVEEEEEENRVLSTEELNKKFDDFIRRMKEDLRIEARRQLVMV